MTSVVVSYFRAIIENIPNELNNRIKTLESEEFDEYADQTEELIKRATYLRKSFYYRKKVYKEQKDNDKAVAKFMVLIHDIAGFLVMCDQKMERMLLNES